MKFYFFHCLFYYVVYHLINHEKSIFGPLSCKFDQFLIREVTHTCIKFQSHHSKYEGGIVDES